MTHEYRRGDQLPSLDLRCRYADGRPFDLTGYAVTPRLVYADGTAKTLEGTLTVVDAASGAVRYDWGAGDLTTPGHKVFSLRAVRTADSAQITFPNGDDPTVMIKVRD